MFSLPRHIFWISAVAVSLAATPAQAADTGGFLTDVQGYASEAAWAMAVYAKALAAGDMQHIQATSFALSGIVSLIGLWLLAVQPRGRIGLLSHLISQAPSSTTTEDVSGESDADRPIRLLEAIAAAKAQMSISEAEKKHAR